MSEIINHHPESDVPQGALPISAELLDLLKSGKPLAQVTAQATAQPDSSELSESDIYGMDENEDAQTVTRTFVLNGKPKRITITTKGAHDAEGYVELITLMQADKDVYGNVLPISVKILPPTGKPFVITSPVYLAELRLLAKVSKLSLNAWAILGKRAGAKGRKAGEHGLQDIVTWAMAVNRIAGEAVAEDEKSAGEGEAQAGSSTC